MNQVTPEKSRQLAAVVIAAGNSSRLGEPKQLLELAGETFLDKVLRLAKCEVESCICVLGYRAKTILDGLKQTTNAKIKFVIHQDWQTGMGSSIAFGVSQTLNADAILICLSDQWALSSHDIKRLVHNWKNHPDNIVASQYFEKRLNEIVEGAPAIFPRSYFPRLLELTSKGARELLKNNPDVIPVPIDNAQFDLDTPEDLRQFQQSINS
ncbi:nucleotidyltransferase family protein [Aliikangiella sp. G2MR2-5]|uniref:nucleotidyltransferase family protein n=1 Tax=Aliikangiella sp. G2MR2-5 TaxID=2788943 RepID=UPI0018A8DE58